jgi:hypothetical protein
MIVVVFFVALGVAVGVKGFSNYIRYLDPVSDISSTGSGCD